MASRVLFVSTGNYYRGRFAEILFNHHAKKRKLSWRAFSRGVALTNNIFCCGGISGFVTMALSDMGIPCNPVETHPTELEKNDLRTASKVVVINEWEHRPWIEKLDAEAAAGAEYWRIRGLDRALPPETFEEIRVKVLELLDDLA